ncbi:hypothetical protein FRC12_016812 [Ceratobasidium sp. 428]|nr:hypothetical protein FRC12_016812 [Ceratobasidium sp. 428]
MPLRVGRRISQLISQTFHTRRPASLQLSLAPTLRCLTASTVTTGPHPKVKRNRQRQQHHAPPPKTNLLRDQLKSLLSAPTNVETGQKLAQLKHTLPTTPEHVCLLAEVLAHHAYVPDALEILSRARAQGVAIPPAYYEPIAFRLAHRNLWRDVLALLEPVQSLLAPRLELSGNRLTTRLCEWRVRACAELGDFTGMERALGKFPHGIPRRAWEIAERACLRNSDPETASRIRHVLKINGVGVGEGEKAKGKEAEWKRLEETVRLLVWKPDGQDRSGDSSTSLGSVRISRTHGSNDPTYLITYTTPSSSHAATITHSFRPSARIAALCIQDLVRGGRAREAATMVASMCKGVPASGRSSASIETSTSRRSLDSTFHALLLPEIFASVKPDIFVFNALLRGVLDTRGLRGMLLTLEIMQEQGVAPNVETGVLLLRYLDRQLAWRPHQLAETLVDLTKPLPRTPGGDRSIPPEPRPVPISIRHTNILLSSILHAERSAMLGGGWKAAAAFLKYRTRAIDRWPPSDARLGSSPNKTDPPTAGLRFQSRTAHLTRVLRALRAQGVRNDPMSYALRAQRDGVIRLDPETARNVLQSADFPLGEYHYAALMVGLVECGYMEAAATVMRAAHDAGFGAKEPVMHTILVSGHGRMGLPREAERVFDDMCKQGIVPDAIAVDALAGAWFISGEYRRAREVVLKHWPDKCGPPCGREANLRTLVTELRKLRPASKVRKKRIGEVTREELQYVKRIVEAIKAPEKVLPPPLVGEKDASKPSARKFSSVAGTGAEGDDLLASFHSSIDEGVDRGFRWAVDRGRKLESRVHKLSASQ